MQAVNRLNFKYLIITAGVGGLAVGAGAVLVNREKTQLHNVPACVKSAVKFMQQHPEVMDLIGEPFELGKTHLDGPMVQFWRSMEPRNDVCARVPIYGKLDNAMLNAYAHRDSIHHKFKITRIEMTFDKIKDKKLILIKKDDKPSNTPKTSN